MASEGKLRKGATKHCCWGTCNSDSRYPDRLSDGTTFVRFPKPGVMKANMSELEIAEVKRRTEKAKKWQHACGRQDFNKLEQIRKDTYMCSLHFVGGKGPTDENPDPLTATSSSANQNIRRRAPRKRQFPCQAPTDSGDGFQCGDLDPSQASPDVEMTESSCEKATQTMMSTETLSNIVEAIVHRNTANVHLPLPNRSLMSSTEILQDSKKCKYFIGISPWQFSALFDFLGDAKNDLTYLGSGAATGRNSDQKGAPRDVSLEEQLFITLLRLRRGFNIATLSHMYSISETLVRKNFTTWIQFLYHHFKDMEELMFPTRQDMKSYLPKVFRCFKNIRCSVDCTEFFCQTPSDYGQQGNMYSAYKHHNTMKCLIAVTPCGAACFVSHLYEGSIDDVTMFRDCGILKHINPGDALLVDKGFTIQDLLLPKQATIFIPPFLGQRNALTKEDELLTRRIAKARIHVERFNERLKKFRLVSGTIPLNLADISSQLVYVSSCLVNFQSFLCK